MTVGRYIYLVGGHDGAAAVDTVWRARILDPLAGPEVVDLALFLDDEVPGVGIVIGLFSDPEGHVIGVMTPTSGS